MAPPSADQASDAPRPRRPRKVRASVACAACRGRKVRCSVASDGPPCTNCRLDGIQCSVPRTRRGRVPSRATQPPPTPQENDPVAQPTQLSAVIIGDESPALVLDSFQSQPDVFGPGPMEMEEGIFESPEEQPSTTCCLSDAILQESQASWAEHSITDLPSFITPIRGPLRRGLAGYLSANEAFHFPSASLRSQLIRGYFRGVHAYYPIFALEDLLVLEDESLSNECEVRFSVLSFQAIMFAAIPVRCSRCKCELTTDQRPPSSISTKVPAVNLGSHLARRHEARCTTA